MTVTDEQLKSNWWAEGDTPVHTDSHVTYLVDGRTAMLEMCLHYLKARKYIYLANWGMTPSLKLVRGTDHRAGPDGSPQQEALQTELRTQGLQDADIDFWNTHDLTLLAVLSHAVSKGVEVKVLLWDCFEVPFYSHYKPQEAHKQLEQVGVICLLDDSSRGILHHPIESLHQKISIVDGRHAFVGGVDPMIENKDYDRWDMPSHPFSTPLRINKDGNTPHPWHDAHALIEGPAAGDVEFNFRERWNDLVQRHNWGSDLLVPEHTPTASLESKSLVQVARTIPEHTYSFQPLIIQGIAQFYRNAISNAKHFMYMENQYLWLRAYTGVDIPFLGYDSPDMERNIHELAEALKRGVTVAITLPDHPNPGRAFSDAGITVLRERAATAAERLHVFCLGSAGQSGEEIHYRPIYVHAKVGIVDDVWATVGSGNLNNRGMRDDTEMNVATLDAELAVGLRMMLWAEHLGLLNDDDLFAIARHLGHQNQQFRTNTRATRILQYLQETLGDPDVGLRMMHERAQDNMRRYKAKQPLVGHLLPYYTVEEAKQQGLPVREDHGWLEEH